MTTDVPYFFEDDEDKLKLKADMIWQVSTDGGTTWTDWDVTPKGTDLMEAAESTNYHFLSNGGHPVFFIAASKLRYPLQEEKYRIIYDANCTTNPSAGASNISGIVTVKMESLVKPGKIVVSENGTDIENQYKMCEDQVTLLLKDAQIGAAYQWYESTNGTSGWTAISGATNDYYVWTAPAPSSNNDYANGIKHYFMVKTKLLPDSAETTVFEVDKYYVPKPKQYVTDPKGITSGLCEGEEFSIGFKSDKAKTIDDYYTKTLYRATAANGAFSSTSDNSLTYSTGSGATYICRI